MTLSSSKEIIQFAVDETIGDVAGFSLISYDIDEVDVILRSPDGYLYFSNSSFYYSSDKLFEKRFNIPFADPGQWSFILRLRVIEEESHLKHY